MIRRTIGVGSPYLVGFQSPVVRQLATIGELLKSLRGESQSGSLNSLLNKSAGTR
jgi:hypothetical protein